jgi:hypothetical protein
MCFAWPECGSFYFRSRAILSSDFIICRFISLFLKQFNLFMSAVHKYNLCFWVAKCIQREVTKGFKKLDRFTQWEIAQNTRWAIFGASPYLCRYTPISYSYNFATKRLPIDGHLHTYIQKSFRLL